MDSQLTQLQLAFLRAFFEREERFYLTGGAALAGFHLGHRTTEDIDLFTDRNVLDEGELVLRAVAEELGARAERTRGWPSYRRWILTRGDEAVVIDLAVESVAQGNREKQRVGKIRIDPAPEILANKLCTLLSRAEARDLVDVLHLLASGLQLEAALELARRKDGGVTPASLGWVLSEIDIPDGARLPGGVSAAQARAFLAELRARLAALAFPGRPG